MQTRIRSCEWRGPCLVPTIRTTDVLKREPPSPRTLPELLAMFEAAEARENPDVVLPLNALVRRTKRTDSSRCPRSRHASPSPTGVVGSARALLGVSSWDRWFENATWRRARGGAEPAPPPRAIELRPAADLAARRGNVSDIDPTRASMASSGRSCRPATRPVRDSVLASRDSSWRRSRRERGRLPARSLGT
jgi:hypothetical protein